jgi:hypothetical protein
VRVSDAAGELGLEEGRGLSRVVVRGAFPGFTACGKIWDGATTGRGFKNP